MVPTAQRLTTAVQHHEAGRLEQAEALYRGILQEMPQHPHALHLLGVLAHQRGHDQEALDLIQRALTIQGQHPVFYSNLAAVYLALDRLEETVACCREALRLQPNLADAHNNLGVALKRLDRLEEAEAAFRQAVRFNLRHLDARCNLGAVLQRQGQLAEAQTLLEETVRLAPGHAQAWNDLGGVLLACNQPEQAELHLREAVRLRPNFAEAYSNLGLALREQHRPDEALQCFHEALRLNPGYTAARNNLGYTLEVQGRIDEARSEFVEVLRRDPNNARAIASLSGLAAAGHFRFSDEEVRRIEAMTARTELPLDDRYRLHFALARLHDRAGAYAEAFAHCCQGNAVRKELLCRRGQVFDRTAHRHWVDRLIAVFSPSYFERVRSFGLDSELPVFIVGMMRSGTTLAEQILASHPRVHGAGELPDMERLVTELTQTLGGAEGYPECLARLDGGTARRLAEGYLQKLRQRGGSAIRVVDKLPANYLNLGIIATLLPRARIIHCRRDPLDACLSCFLQNFGEPHPFTLDLADLGHYYREYERLMAHWTHVLPMPIFELSYEELTADQEGVSRRLLAFCGLEWDERCLRFHDTRRPVRTASALQVRQPLYRSSVGRGQHYRAYLGPLLEALRGEE